VRAPRGRRRRRGRRSSDPNGPGLRQLDTEFDEPTFNLRGHHVRSAWPCGQLRRLS
jgi:hypothetical protein